MQSFWFFDEIAFIKLLMMMPHSNWNIPSHSYGISEKMKNKKIGSLMKFNFIKFFGHMVQLEYSFVSGIFLLLSTLFSQD
jgi:hypothetical protein